MHGECSLFGGAWVISDMRLDGMLLCNFSEVHVSTFKGNRVTTKDIVYTIGFL